MGSLSDPARHLIRRAVLCLALVATSDCVRDTPAPEPAISSLLVRNRSFFDINVYIYRSATMPVRIGTVTGPSNGTFALHAHDLQPGGWLAVRVHAIGTLGSWTSDPVYVTTGMTAVLDVNSDAFGDCSTSSLYTVMTMARGAAEPEPSARSRPCLQKS